MLGLLSHRLKIRTIVVFTEASENYSSKSILTNLKLHHPLKKGLQVNQKY